MKCPKCNNDLFKGQFQCEVCGTIVAELKEEEKEEKKEEKKNGK